MAGSHSTNWKKYFVKLSSFRLTIVVFWPVTFFYYNYYLIKLLSLNQYLHYSLDYEKFKLCDVESLI